MPAPPVPTRAGPYLSAQNSMISVREQMAEAVAGAPTSLQDVGLRPTLQGDASHIPGCSRSRKMGPPIEEHP